jgi:light-harvesting complex I chlorophyll a/b binding protein 1/light-harvesting complex I chlorophyll a/b binding protein 4
MKYPPILANTPPPLGQLKCKSEAEVADMKLKEIKNGRLAMLAIGGMIHHNFIFGEPLF